MSDPSPRALRSLGAHAQPLALVFGSFLVGLLGFRPFGNVLYGGDDWAYAWSSRHLLETGELRGSAWVTAAAVPQTVWGALWSAAFGYRPLILNLSTMFAASVGLGLLYAIGLKLGIARWPAALLTAFVAVTPHYLGFAASFMSDMYYAVLMLAAILPLLVALERGSIKAALGGGVLASAAMLNRQIGIALPAAFGATLALLWLRDRRDFRPRLALAAAGVGAPFLTLLVLKFARNLVGGLTLAQAAMEGPFKERLRQVGLTVSHVHLTLVYVATMLLPFLLALALRSRVELGALLRRRPLWVGVVAAAGFFLALGRVWTPKGLIVRGEFLHTRRYGAAPLAHEATLWHVAACVACALVAPFIVATGERLVAWWRQLPPSETPEPIAEARPFLVLCFLAHVVLTSSYVTYYNNYFLPLLPLAALLAASSVDAKPFAPRWPAWALLAGSLLPSVLVLDSLDRLVEASERATNELVADGVSDAEIFGYPSSYGFRHYELLDKDLTEHRKSGLFGVFSRIRKGSSYYTANPEIHLHGDEHWELERTLHYGTLLGGRELAIYRRADVPRIHPRHRRHGHRT